MQGLALKTVLIPKSLVEELVSDRTKYLPNETGGYLLGQRWQGDIEVLTATRQGPGDKATPYSFDRNDDESHVRIAMDRWKMDEGRTSYVGDWHSHPSGDASPSGKDRKAWSILEAHSNGPIIGMILGETKRVRVFRCAKSFGLVRVTECFSVGEDDTHFRYAPRGSEASDNSKKIKA